MPIFNSLSVNSKCKDDKLFINEYANKNELFKIESNSSVNVLIPSDTWTFEEDRTNKYGWVSETINATTNDVGLKFKINGDLMKGIKYYSLSNIFHIFIYLSIQRHYISLYRC